ncbi:MAG: F0F1 ATP synthase subunit delta [Pseudomonadota bacterium]
MSGEQTIVSGVAGRYATALIELARDAGSVDAVAEQLDRFSAALDDSEDLKRLVTSPVFGADEQVAALDALFPKMHIDGLAANVVKLMARNRRLFVIGNMISDYHKLVAAERGEVTAEVTSAMALNDTQIADLKSALKASVGKDVDLVQTVDPSILGGLVVRLGSRMIDTSLKTKLSSLKLRMKEVG